ncbi:hypothetical protein NPIL_502251 [Nephila pilipes]|uniref:RNase H type-1 domain-containing protein n=1 Tax=Nephila pilipes TaxID=299642 RepID=A0A8X6NWF4_NEPPI|nr:hypothetical protein NPIL_668011 [Nephila pilipes]GFT36824.1 hypothetical protein NPIL_502251 [Nephila pilipes]
MGFMNISVEGHTLKSCRNPSEGLPRVHFNADLVSYTRMSRSRCFENNIIPSKALQTFTDGSKNEDNLNFSVLIAIEESLKASATCTAHQDIWILTNSSNSIRHLQNCLPIGD